MLCNENWFLEGRGPNGNLLTRGRHYSDPIGDMCRVLPPDCTTPAAITEALQEAGFYLVLIESSMNQIVARIALKANARRAAE